MKYSIGDAESAIKIRKSATTYRYKGRRRRQEVREYMKLGYKKWAKKVKYGLRWAIEGIFSSIKRKFGEDLRARSVIGLLAEAMQKGSIRTSTKSVLIVLHKLAQNSLDAYYFIRKLVKNYGKKTIYTELFGT
ncbi:MAG: transposase [Thaumarchaeota archaeon]|jgi:hypothetical protein|nr:transposase [Nitrososphaerota archaeon]